MRRFSHRTIVIVPALAIAILLGVGVSFFITVRKFRRAENLITRTHAVVTTLDALFSGLVDAESARRGYLLTGDAPQLDDYYTVLENAPRKLAELRELTADSPVQQKHLDALQPLVQQRLGLVRESVGLVNQGSRDQARQLVLTQQGKELRRQIRGILDEMNAEEDRLLEIRNRNSGANYRRSVAFLLIGSLTSILLISWVFFLLSREIAAQKQIEEQLQASHFYTRSLVESNTDAVIATDPAGIVTDVNRQMELLTGRTREKLIGTPFKNYFTDPARAQEGIRLVLRKSRVTDYELTAQSKDGKETVVSYNATTFQDQTGKLQGVFVAAHDITARKRAEEDLAGHAEALARSNEELAQFAYVASHDLQEPLRKIVAFGDRLRAHSGATLDEQAQDYLARMQNAGRRMGQLIESLLELSRVTTKGEKFETAHLNRIVSEVLVDLEARIQQTRGRVEVQSLPTLLADPLQMRQMFQNLIGNALKFHKENEPPVVRVSSHLGKDGFWEIHVQDNGIGFEEKYLSRIFRPFQCLHGRGEFEGSGMGLAICHKIVARHSGQITARSQPGIGSDFVVTLPARAVAKEANAS